MKDLRKEMRRASAMTTTGITMLLLWPLLSTAIDVERQYRFERHEPRVLSEGFDAYSDGQMLRFGVPEDTAKANFGFSVDFSFDCRPTTIHVFVQGHSYPVVVGDKGRFPEHMRPWSPSLNISFNPADGEQFVEIKAPRPGPWFALVYVDPKKPQSYAEETLAVHCSLQLRSWAEYALERDIVHLLPEKHNHQKILLYHNINRPQTYKFFAGSDVWSASVRLSKCRVKRIQGSDMKRLKPDKLETTSLCPITISASPWAPPDPLDPTTRKLDCSSSDDEVSGSCSMSLLAEENAWHYITLTPSVSDRRVEFAIGVVITDCPRPRSEINYLLVNKINPHEVCSDVTKNTRSAIQLLFPPYRDDEKIGKINNYDNENENENNNNRRMGANMGDNVGSFDRGENGLDEARRLCGKRIRLARDSMKGVFAFRYTLPPAINISSLNSKSPLLSSSGQSSLKDSLKSNVKRREAFGVSLENGVASVMQFELMPTDIGGSLVLEMAIDNAELSGRVSETIEVKACLSVGRRLVPSASSNFDPFSPSLSSQITSTEEQSEEQTLCPSGRLLSLNTSASAVRIEPKFRKVMVPFPKAGHWFLTVLPSCRQINILKGNQETYYESSECSSSKTPLLVKLYSDMCVDGGCGKYGRCYQYVSSGQIFSSCSCFAGYRGWGCSDEREATTEIDLLAATLLLCLSNLVFLPAVGLAVYRGFYTESFVYFANMLFSTLYHACDQDAFSFCLLKYSVLQFCDAFTATLAFWVTALAMAGLPEQAKSLLHMVGAIGIALAIQHDPVGSYTFAIPAATAILLLFAGWIWHCSSDGACFPGVQYACCCFLPGLCVLLAGAFCFLFMEAEHNFQFVHSLWHVAIATAILFLLPPHPFESQEDRYVKLDGRGVDSSAAASSSAAAPISSFNDTSFKHYSEELSGEVINVTSSASNTILPPDQVINVTHNGNNKSNLVGLATLPRSSLANRPQEVHHGTMRRLPDDGRMNDPG